ncbi:tail fiber domain-containing protein [Ekhidna sp.]|uniref:tail fiber domain-containing protein n=1 Tax=Ekhidna sp. TaxID=2608089 RepID=UPI003CCBA354
MKTLRLLFLLCFVTIGVFAQNTGDGGKMTFQGSLFQNGEPVNGTVELTFSIPLPNGEWTETISGVSVANGLYSVVLGNTNPIPNDLFMDAAQRSVTVTVDGTSLGQVNIYPSFVPGIIKVDSLLSNRLIIENDQGNYVEVTNNFYRIRNRSEGASSVYLTNGGTSRLQLADFDSLGATRSLSFFTARPDGTSNITMERFSDAGDRNLLLELYSTDRFIDGTVLRDGYARGGVDFYNNRGEQTSWFTSMPGDENGGDPDGWSAGMGLYGTNSINFIMEGKKWENNDLGSFQMYGEHGNGDGWYHRNIAMNVNSDGTNNWGQIELFNSVEGAGGEVQTVNIDGQSGNMYIAGDLTVDGVINSSINVDFNSSLYTLQNPNDGQQIGDIIARDNGTQLNLMGFIDGLQNGGGVSMGTKWFNFDPAQTQLGYFHLRGTVNPANYFDANMKVAIEATRRGDGEEAANILMYGNILDGDSKALPVMKMETVPNGDYSAWGAQISMSSVDGAGESQTVNFNSIDGSGYFSGDLVVDGNLSANVTPIDGNEFNVNYGDGTNFVKADPNTSSGRFTVFSPAGTQAARIFSSGGNFGRFRLYSPNGQNDTRLELGVDSNEGGYAQFLDAGLSTTINLTGANGSGYFAGDLTVDGNLNANINPNFDGISVNSAGLNIFGEFSRMNIWNSSDSSYQVVEAFEENNYGIIDLRDENGNVSISLQGSTGAASYIAGDLTVDGNLNANINPNFDGTSVNSAGLNIFGDFSRMNIWNSTDSSYQVVEAFEENDYGIVDLRDEAGDVSISLQGSTGAASNFTGDLNVNGNLYGNNTNANQFSLSNGRANITSGNQGNGDFGQLNLNSTVGDGSNRISMGFADLNETAGFFSLWNSNNELALMNVVLDGGGNYGALSLGGPGSVTLSGQGNIDASGYISASDLYFSGASPVSFNNDVGIISTNEARLNTNVLVGDQGDNAVDINNNMISITAGGTGSDDGTNTISIDGATRVIDINSSDATYNAVSIQDASSGGEILVSDNTGQLWAHFQSANRQLVVSNDGGTNGAFVTATGMFGGDGTGSYNIGYDGNATFSGTVTATSFPTSSDKRFKDNIEPLTNSLSNTLKISGYTYKWNDVAKEVKGISDEKEQIGVLAQELEKVYPQLVKTDAEGYKSVNYPALTTVLIEAIKELNAEVKTLKAENEELKSNALKTAELSKRIETIEKLLELKAESSTSSAKN